MNPFNIRNSSVANPSLGYENDSLDEFVNYMKLSKISISDGILILKPYVEELEENSFLPTLFVLNLN